MWFAPRRSDKPRASPDRQPATNAGDKPRASPDRQPATNAGGKPSPRHTTSPESSNESDKTAPTNDRTATALTDKGAQGVQGVAAD